MSPAPGRRGGEGAEGRGRPEVTNGHEATPDPEVRARHAQRADLEDVHPAGAEAGTPPPTRRRPDSTTGGGLSVEVLDAGDVDGWPPVADVRRLVRVTCATHAVTDGHVAIACVDEDRIRALNREHRGRDAATDVLSFPVDGAGPVSGPRELGDVVIHPPATVDLREAIVHGLLHLLGMDHETDDGEMLALQAQLLRWMPADGTP